MWPFTRKKKKKKAEPPKMWALSRQEAENIIGTSVDFYNYKRSPDAAPLVLSAEQRRKLMERLLAARSVDEAIKRIDRSLNGHKAHARRLAEQAAQKRVT
jgi:hypothetical protein